MVVYYPGTILLCRQHHRAGQTTESNAAGVSKLGNNGRLVVKVAPLEELAERERVVHTPWTETGTSLFLMGVQFSNRC